ncbi:DUF6492 family protein [Hamadaea tsunoensis]|uniref:DUF6492 family protein n=1 Tax=Hamadaea tsunoensis TaxID=53368 RepID=UPI00040B6F9F|nr:DUF6492 family protein [Hamadaea tsunoensis]
MADRLAVVTPSFAGDFELSRDLNASVLAYAPPDVHHHLIVPRRDLELFGSLSGPRTHVLDETDFLPRSVRHLPGTKYSLNLRRPFPPLRGWIIQQIVKLASGAVDADTLLLVDSDISFCRPFGPDTFVRDGVARFYRKPNEIDDRLPRHVLWHKAAREMLGLPAAPPPYHDYVSSILAWDPAILTEMFARIEKTTGSPWPTVVGSQLHFSEWTLYGVFVDEVLGARATSFASDDALCHTYWDDTPLDDQTVRDFLGKLSPTDVAVMISAKSRTPLETRRAALKEFNA